MVTMKAKELAEQLLRHPDFDVEFGFLEPDGSSWGIRLRRFVVMIDDIGYSSKKVILGPREEIK